MSDTIEGMNRIDVDNGVLYERTERTSSCLIVFVHGVFGNPDATWKDFPRFILQSPEAGYADGALFHYETPVLSRTVSVESCATLLRSWLMVRCHKYRHVVVLAHSLGGLVSKRCLIDLFLNASAEARELRQKLRLFFLYAVPHHGSHVGNLASAFLRKNQLAQDLSLNSLSQQAINKTIRELKSTTAATGERFPRFKIVFGIKDSVVEQSSAIPNEGAIEDSADLPAVDADFVLAVDATHGSIVKPQSADETSVVALRQQIDSICGMDSNPVWDPLSTYFQRALELYQSQEVANGFVAPARALRPWPVRGAVWR